MTRIAGALHEDVRVCTVLTISRQILPRMRNVSDKSCRKIETHILR
jgi:hypothetical protein